MMSSAPSPFGDITTEQLSVHLDHLPNQVQINVWGDATASLGEREAVRLGSALANAFEGIHFQSLPRRENYPYYPVFGILGGQGPDYDDRGVRLIGLPAGYQITSLIAAIQAVAFKGSTLEPRTRLALAGLAKEVAIEVLTAADDEAGAVVAKHAFGLAVASRFVRTYLIMADVFPEALIRYSARGVPHTILNSQLHADGPLQEEALLRLVARAAGVS